MSSHTRRSFLKAAALRAGAAGLPGLARAQGDIRVAIAEGLKTVEVGGGPMMISDLSGRSVLNEAPTWLRATVRSGAIEVAGRRVNGLRLTPADVGFLRTGNREYPGALEIHLVGDRVLLVNQADAHWQGRDVGSVITFRDHTELRAVSGELDTVRGLAEALRAQNHEASNRLHTVVSLIELGRVDDAVRFATEELETAQVLTDVVVGSVHEPVVAAVLLGKSAQAAERGIDLVIDEATAVTDLAVEPRDVVTILGNLLDNAFDAVATAERKQVRVRVHADADVLEVDVDDSGPGLPEDVREHVFRRGWSTKRGDHAVGRGLGLALVGQVVRRHGGRVRAGQSPLGGARFTVRIGGAS